MKRTLGGYRLLLAYAVQLEEAVTKKKLEKHKLWFELAAHPNDLSMSVSCLVR
jgi:hypothetical protein